MILWYSELKGYLWVTGFWIPSADLRAGCRGRAVRALAFCTQEVKCVMCHQGDTPGGGQGRREKASFSLFSSLISFY
jgi:hypothetical protein